MNTQLTQHTIDAADRPVGRIATEIAMLLMGKTTPAYRRNRTGDVRVRVEHVNQARIAESKKNQKTYYKYSGYPGGLKEKTMGKLISEKGTSEVLRRAVEGMLPKNKLRPVMMKRLEIAS